MIPQKINYRRWSLVVLLALMVGLLCSILIFNWHERKKNIYLEVTFVDPHQAVIFWKTPNDTTGFVKYGEQVKNLDKTAVQTSSVPGQIHAVVISEVPTSGLFAEVHNESDSFLYRPRAFKIRFDPNTFQE